MSLWLRVKNAGHPPSVELEKVTQPLWALVFISVEKEGCRRSLFGSMVWSYHNKVFGIILHRYMGKHYLI